MTKNEMKASELLNEFFEETKLWSTLEEFGTLLENSDYFAVESNGCSLGIKSRIGSSQRFLIELLANSFQ